MALGRRPQFLIAWTSASSRGFFLAFENDSWLLPESESFSQKREQSSNQNVYAITSDIFYWSHRMPYFYECHTQRCEYQEQGIIENHLGTISDIIAVI